MKSKYQINFQNFFLTAVLNWNVLLMNNFEKGKAQKKFVIYFQRMQTCRKLMM